tara:strand:+ start:979 stop:1284 length:306 start_codon:yes stop_codon:yes gene_type:complete
MITGNMLVMFIIGFIIFSVYLYALLRAIYWGHNSQKQDMLNDPELRNYYSRHGMPDTMDYDGHGNYGRFPNVPKKNKKIKKGSQSRIKNYFWHKDKVNNDN